MKMAYRLVHFTPNPLNGARFALGAVVSDGTAVRVVKASHIPGPDCLGQRKAHVLARMLLRQMDSIRASDELPSSFGPYVHLDDAREIPDGVEDAHAWVQKFILDGERDKDTRNVSRAPSRKRYGERFFRTWQLSHLVKSRYTPSTDWDGWLAHAGALKPVTHWVASTTQLLLMEPLVPSREQFESDAKDVWEKFAAYRWAMSRGDTHRRGTLCAFILPDGDRQSKRRIARELEAVADTVIDTDDERSRTHFIDLVREVGAASALIN